MSRSFRVAVLVGSLRKDSFSRKMAHALIALAPSTLRCEIVEIRDLAIYDEDMDKNPPVAWKSFKQKIAAADAVLFVTPEYNRSIPGCLKNALDVGSRPEGENVWDGKPAAIVSVTPYHLGAFGANHALRQALVYLNIPAMQQPEAYIGEAEQRLQADGGVNAETTKQFTEFMAAFEGWVSALDGASGQPFVEFMKQRDEAASAYVRGDASPLDKLVASDGSASFFPPGGGKVTGASVVKTRYDGDAKSFGASGKSELEIVQSEARGGLAFWTGIQHAEVEFDGKTQLMKLRITEVFERQGSEWKLIHRHTDMKAEAKQK